MKIGEMLLAEGLINQEQLDHGLKFQETTEGKKLGEILIELGYVTLEDFSSILHLQIQHLDPDMLQAVHQ